jgi:hypothetical protein
MSVSSVGSNTSSSIGTLLLQQLSALGTNSQDASSSAGLLGDLMTLSPAAQQLTKAPDEVTKALSDLLSGQKDTAGDLAQLKAYFQKNPQSLATVLSSLQGGNAVYGTAGNLGSNSALLTALMNARSNNSNPASLLSLLKANGDQSSLFSFLGDSGSGSDNSALSIFG